MPYLAMYLGEEKIDELYISDFLLQSVIGQHIVAEEKKRLSDKHGMTIRNSGKTALFSLDTALSGGATFPSIPSNEGTDPV